MISQMHPAQDSTFLIYICMVAAPIFRTMSQQSSNGDLQKKASKQANKYNRNNVSKYPIQM